MKMVVELSNGQAVELKEVWNCAEGINDSGSAIEVYDADEGNFICSINGSLPDTDDEDYNEAEFIKALENEISWANF